MPESADQHLSRRLCGTTCIITCAEYFPHSNLLPDLVTLHSSLARTSEHLTTKPTPTSEMMARTKQTANRVTKTPQKGKQANDAQNTTYQAIEAIVAERSSLTDGTQFKVVWEGKVSARQKTSWIDAADCLEADILEYRTKVAANTATQPRDRVFTSKPTIRRNLRQAPDLQSHGSYVLCVAVNPTAPECATVHQSLFPARTLAVLERKGHALIPGGQRFPFVRATSETFEVYRCFLYTGNLFTYHGENDQDHADDGESDAHEDREWLRLAHAYLLGLDLKDERFCNAVIDGIVEKVKEMERYPTGLATEVYAPTTLGDKLRNLLVDLHVWIGRGSGVRAPHDDANGPAQFISDVESKLQEVGEAVDTELVPWVEDACQYHAHEFTAKCEVEQRVEEVAGEPEAVAIPETPKKPTRTSPRKLKPLPVTPTRKSKRSPAKSVKSRS